MTPCPECERNKFRAAMWRAEAYKQAGHDKIERPWVGLTDEEVHQGFCHVEYETPNDWNTDPDDWCQQFARYLEAKLKEKNT